MKKILGILGLLMIGALQAQTLKFSDFTAETAPAGTDYLVGYRTPGVAGGNRRFSLTTLQTYFASGSQPLDADLTALAALSGTNTIYYRSAANTWGPVSFVGATFSGGVLTISGATVNDETGLGVDGAGSVLTAGVVVERTVASPFTIVAWYIVTDQSGSVIMDVLKGTSSGSTTSYSSIAGSGLPAVSSADNASGNVSLWSSPTFVAGDKIRLRINGTPTSVTRATITFKITRP